MSDKIKPQHLARKAVLYVRQSSPQQVQNNRESQKLQYAMEAHLRSLGWSEIEIIDEDLGRSAGGSVTRTGFERMVAQVCLGEVGAICARELSRFARNSREWQHLIEMSRLVDTLLVDQEAVYSPRLSNDRLLLGLKGSLHEYELDLLRQRASAARLEKARRGELHSNVPVGFIKDEDGSLQKDPDQRIGGAIRLAFAKFLELGSVRQTLFWFLEQGLTLPARTMRGDVHWRQPTYSYLHNLLTNPSYGGIYAYGKTETVVCFEQGISKVRTRQRARDGWIAHIPGAHEGYLSGEEFERIQTMIADNRLDDGSPGATLRGNALLGGVLRCRRCGRRLRVCYKGASNAVIRYLCPQAQVDNQASRCIAFNGAPLDAAVAACLLRVVEPAAIEAALMAAEQYQQERAGLLDALARDLQAARYRAHRAERQYEASDPENRLVTQELERRWNAALLEVQRIEARMEAETKSMQSPPPGTLEEFQDLAGDLETLWNDPHIDFRAKKRLLRALIREVLVDIEEATSEIVVLIHWKGGVHTPLRLKRRRPGQHSHCVPENIVEAVRTLSRILNDERIAGFLNRAKIRTVRGNFWTRALVTSLRFNHGIDCYDPERQVAEGWINLSQAARLVGVTKRTLRLAIECGKVTAERPIPAGPWVLNKQTLQKQTATLFLKKGRPLLLSDPGIPTSAQAVLDLSTT
jgi:DNA invertase Pin-like site-specific DNA recombinase